MSQPKTFPASRDATALADAIRSGATTARAAADACISAVSGVRLGNIFGPISDLSASEQEIRAPIFPDRFAGQ